MDLNLEKRLITKNDVFNRLSSLEIFKSYCANFDVSKPIHSPFRKDKNPSLGFFIGRKGEIVFKDLATGETGDCLDFVQKLFNLSYFEALSKIACDFQFEKCDFFFKDMSYNSNKVSRMNKQQIDSILSSFEKPLLTVKTREWNNDDARYWFSVGVTFKALQFYNVHPVELIFINDTVIKADKLSYAFVVVEDNIEYYKIYQPFNKEGKKWFSSQNSEMWLGWNQLPETGTDLIITKSMKDVMALGSILRIPAVALQSETTKPSYSKLDLLKKRFRDIYILFDNDYDKEINIGRIKGKELTDDINGYQLEIPDIYKSKDFTDLIINLSKDKSRDEAIKEASYIISKQLIPF